MVDKETGFNGRSTLTISVSSPYLVIPCDDKSRAKVLNFGNYGDVDFTVITTSLLSELYRYKTLLKFISHSELQPKHVLVRPNHLRPECPI